jgi:hypothetical protein
MCVAAPASAQWTRHHASECIPQTSFSLTHFVVAGTGVTNMSASSSPIDVACPSDDTDAYPDSDLTEVRVHVYDGSPTHGITVQACSVVRDPKGGWSNCSRIRETSDEFVGAAVITLSSLELETWSHGDDFDYLYITIPPRSGSLGFSHVKGWITQQ